jgi:hypothetical protein
METVIFIYRNKWSREPEFRVIEDGDLIVAREIDGDATEMIAMGTSSIAEVPGDHVVPVGAANGTC